MRIAIASGKGGAGKTTIAVNLAYAMAHDGHDVEYIDCDVEEPNGHLFLKPTITESFRATLPVPVVDESRCTACGACVKMCQYNALVRLGDTVMVFPGLCHGCGGCELVCKHGAISEQPRQIGDIRRGMASGIGFVDGRLAIGEAMSPPLIRGVLDKIDTDRVSIIDAPPGTSCPVVTSLRTADFVLLVTDPTPFGLNDLGLAIDLVNDLNLPHGVIVNRAGLSDAAREYCRSRGVPILAELPDRREIAEIYSKGYLLCNEDKPYRDRFLAMWEAVHSMVAEGTA